jgi:glutamate 5-kinase
MRPAKPQSGQPADRKSGNTEDRESGREIVDSKSGGNIDSQRALLVKARRVVVKLGSGVVCNAQHEFDQDHVSQLAASIAALVRDGRQVVLVSSGAITLGASELGVHRSRLRDASVNRACAAVGQCKLMDAYAEAFRPHKLIPAQVLVTEDDFTDLNRYLILRQTFEKLLKLGAVPVVNENDTVTNIYTEQAPVFRDNDRLAALVLSKLDAEALVLLSNVDGLLRTVDGTPDPSSVVPIVTEISADIRDSASGKSATGRGGMTAKLDAAAIAMQAGGLVVIANGKTPGILERIFSGENIGTLFLPGERLAGKRRWLAFASSIRGQVTINANAHKALVNGHASLLLSGVTACKGEFSKGQVIAVVDSAGTVIGRGIAECGSHDISVAISNGATAKGVLVRRENFLIFSGKESTHA